MKVSVRKYVKKSGTVYNVVITSKSKLTGKLTTNKVAEANTLYDANIIADTYRERILNGDIESPDKDVEKVRLNDCIQMELEQERKRNKGVKNNTLRTYKSLFEKHIADDIGQIYIQQLTKGLVQNFIDEKAENYSKTTVNNIFVLIKKGVEYAVSENFINSIGINKVIIWGKKTTKNSKENCIPSSDLMNILSMTNGTRLGVQIALSSMLGLRKSEVLGLSWNDIDLENKILKINNIVVPCHGGQMLQPSTKNSENPEYVLPSSLIKILKKYKATWNEKYLLMDKKDNAKLLFSKADGSPDSLTKLNYHFNKVMKENGYEDITFHALRHSYATLLSEQGYDIEQISKMLNHKNSSTTRKVYVHLTDKTKNEVANTIDTVFSAN